MVRFWIDSTVPDLYIDNPAIIQDAIKMTTTFMSKNLINGILYIELKKRNQVNNQMSLLLNILGSGTPEKDVSSFHKPEGELLKEFQELKLDYQYELISFQEKNNRMNVKMIIPLTLREKEEVVLYPQFKDKKMLIVEDNEVNAMVFSGFLEDWGIISELASNGQEGVDMVSVKSYDAVLMDIYMPVLNGIEATRKIRKFNTHVPIIALSASSLQDDKEKSIEVGVNEYLSKPVTSIRLLEAISKWM